MPQTHTWGPYTVLGTTWFITLPIDCHHAEAAVQDAWQWLDTFDGQYSRFKSDSYIGQLNHTGNVHAPPQALRDLLHTGIDWFTRSAGHLNFLTGHLQAARGYNAAIDLKETPLPTGDLPDPTRDLVVTTNQVTLHQGAVDLGSFGKGYAIDQLTKRLREQTGSSFCLVNGGGDLYLHNPEQHSYPLYLSHPWEPEKFTHVLETYHGGLANSNASLRQWKTKNTGQRYSHLLDLTDPTRDVDTLAAATVCATNALDADAYATLLTLLPHGPDNDRLIPLPYLRIFADGSSRETTDFPARALV